MTPARRAFTFRALVEQLRDPRQPLLVPILALLASRVLFALAQPFASDDAYITFRYAKHLAEGLGLTYNAGDRVMGFTSLPWTLWCALGIGLHVSPVVWTQVSSILADIVTLVLTVGIVTGSCGRASAWTFATFFSLWPLFAASAISGLEISALFLLMILSATLVERRGPGAGLALGMLAIMRPEGLLASLVLSWRADRTARVTALAVAVAAYGALWAYFGSVVPQSVAAKAALYGTPGPWIGRHWWEWLVPLPIGRFPTTSEGIHLMPMAILFAASTIRGAGVLWEQRERAVAFVAAAGIAILLGYTILGVAYFWWYLVVPLGACGLIAAAGLPRVVSGRLVPTMATAYMLGAWSLAFPLYLGRARAEYRNNMSVARILAERAQANDTVLLEPIGMIGYASGLRVIDEVGIVTPEVVARRLTGSGWYSDIVSARRPTWLVMREQLLENVEGYAGAGDPLRSPQELQALLSRYHLVWPDRPLDGIVFRVYRRND